MNTAVPQIAKSGPPLIIQVGSQHLQIGNPPSERQWIFLNAAETEQLYGGAKRGGKTVALCEKLMWLAVAFPGNRLGFFRKTLKDFRESTLVTWDKLFPESHPLILRHHRTQYYYTIRTSGPPSYLVYGGLGDIHEVETAKGKDYGTFAIDEPSEIEEETYLQLLAQLCWTLPNGERPPYMALLGSNPEPGWVEDRFKPLIDATSDTVGSASDGNKIFVRALPKDNPYLPPNWEAALRVSVKNQAWVDKYLGGSWDVSEGQLFKEFDRGTHCIDVPSPEYLRRLKLYASIDHATTGTTCMVILGQDEDTNFVALGSYYEQNRLISEHAKGMRQLMDEWAVRCGKEQVVASAPKEPGVHPAFYAFEYVLIDPSTAAKTQQSAVNLTSVQDEYRRQGIPTMAAWNALETGLNLVQEYVHVRPAHVHPFKKANDGGPIFGSPTFFVIEANNRAGVKEIIRLKRTVDVGGRIKYVGSDHWLDNVRYVMMSRPEPPDKTPNDVLFLDTITRRVNQSHEKWAKGFGVPPSPNQWFGRAN